eukprot:comp18235_c0_seq2/m.32236 comp18235_c0_seq2/g.32236  ORF comp18235_c0_seq2/g.32236 comp18235_c0_seq2/m.32236 type:complete len:383 (-) comp18235_c0_seq2:91-1239(-)
MLVARSSLFSRAMSSVPGLAFPLKNLEIRLKERPTEYPTNKTFEFVNADVSGNIKDGEVIVRNIYLSLDPAMRGWMNDRKSYIPPVALGDVMRGGCVGEVVVSQNPKFPAGSMVVGMTGWQRYAVSDGKNLSHVVPGVPLPSLLGVVGMTGLTAYFGLLDIGQPKEGETVLVSAAAGAVGSIVGQIAKLKGCKVVGIAGSDEKCEFIKKEYGFDAAINYKSNEGSMRKAIRIACPNGVDIFFDNVGGETLDAALANINVGARIPLCGAISQYNTAGAWAGPANYHFLLTQRARMEGFIVFDFAKRYKPALTDLAGWFLSGKIKAHEDVVDGLENAPAALLKLFQGTNRGKLLVRIAPESLSAAPNAAGAANAAGSEASKAKL